MAARARVERKVGVLTTAQDDARLLSWLPDAVSPFVLAVIPTAVTFVAGWKARHTPRPGPEVEG